MKIRLISYKNIELDLVIEKKYKYDKPIISIGNDCHPAYILNSLNLRNVSFPFDWLYTTPSRGIDYINKNLKENFKSFLSNLTKNERGYVTSRCYLDSEFFHYSDLIDNKNTKNMLSRRSKRFLDYFNNKRCLFLFNISSGALKNSSDISLFLDSVNKFHALAKGNHTLLVYIRYDESFQENENNCKVLENELRNLKHTRIAKYI